MPIPTLPAPVRPTPIGECVSLTRAALDAAARGWHVFPVIPGRKRPAVKAWEPRATTDPDRIRLCWQAGPFNIGIACGPSGLLVVDLDMPKPGQHPPVEWQMDGVRDGADVFTVVCERAGVPVPEDTWTVTTGTGGTHLYYRQPDSWVGLRNTAGALGWLVDTRGAGGYVLAAGSIVDSRTYTVAWQTDPAPLPDWLTGRLTPAPVPAGPVTINLGTVRRAAYLDAAIRRQLGHLTEATTGQRNRVLYQSAANLGELVAGGALAGADVARLLTPAALAIGLSATETARTIASGLRAGANRPRSVAA